MNPDQRLEAAATEVKEIRKELTSLIVGRVVLTPAQERAAVGGLALLALLVIGALLGKRKPAPSPVVEAPPPPPVTPPAAPRIEESPAAPPAPAPSPEPAIAAAPPDAPAQ